MLEHSSIKAFDSIHLANAEQGADVLVTTDIKFIKAANRMKPRVPVKDPITLILEVIKNEYDY